MTSKVAPNGTTIGGTTLALEKPKRGSDDVVQIIGIDRSIAGEGPWPIEAPPDGRPLAAVRFRIQRLDDDGFVQSFWDGGAHARLSLRLGTRAALRSHARRDDTDSWAIRLYRLIEVLRDWTPVGYQQAR